MKNNVLKGMTVMLSIMLIIFDIIAIYDNVKSIKRTLMLDK